MQIDLTQIILAVITLIGAIITRYLIPWLKDRLDERKMETLNGLVSIGVYAAEQLFNSNQGKEKKQYVLNLLKERGYIVDEEHIAMDLDALIESTVKELKIATEK